MACRPHRDLCAPPRARVSAISCVAAICLALSGAEDSAAGADGDSGREARQQAIRELPMRQLAPAHRKEVSRVVQDASLFRSMPERVVECDDELFALMVDRPDVMVDIWRVLNISKLRLSRLEPDAYEMTDATGTTGEVKVLYVDRLRDGSRRVLARAQGVYDAPPMPRPVKATTIFLFTWKPFVESDGRACVGARLDAFVHLDRPAAELIARAVAPLAVKTADHNFAETLRFLSMFSRTAERNPSGVERLAENLTGVDPPARQQLALVCYDVARRAHAQAQSQASTSGVRTAVQAVASDAPPGVADAIR